MKKLSEQQEENLKSTFLKTLGEKIRSKRIQKSLSQHELANCLHISAASLSQYENGNNDMKVSGLALISTYCDFPLTDYFDREQSRELLKSFSKFVQITKRKYQREKRGKIYNADRVQETPVQYERHSQKEFYLKAVMPATEKAFTDEEVVEYLQKNKSPEFLKAMTGAEKFIDYLSGQPEKERIREIVADTMIEEILIEPIVHNAAKKKAALRMYAYYKAMMNLRNIG